MVRDIKLRYKVLLYGLSMWQPLGVLLALFVILQQQVLIVIIAIPMFILMPLHYIISHIMAESDGKIKNKYYDTNNHSRSMYYNGRDVDGK